MVYSGKQVLSMSGKAKSIKPLKLLKNMRVKSLSSAYPTSGIIPTNCNGVFLRLSLSRTKMIDLTASSSI